MNRTSKYKLTGNSKTEMILNFIPVVFVEIETDELLVDESSPFDMSPYFTEKVTKWKMANKMDLENLLL